jgi:hypothetical protein
MASRRTVPDRPERKRDRKGDKRAMGVAGLIGFIEAG